VGTFRASGNVIFESAAGVDEAGLSKRIEAGLGEALGYEVPVFLRSCARVAKIAAREPFPAERVEAAVGKLQVALLPGPPRKAARREALAMATGEDRLAIAGSELFWLPSGGISETDLDLRGLESLLGPWTMRTKGTIEQIAARHCA
jgi:uncharacterized protein (DUF1697 family)